MADDCSQLFKVTVLDDYSQSRLMCLPTFFANQKTYYTYKIGLVGECSGLYSEAEVFINGGNNKFKGWAFTQLLDEMLSNLPKVKSSDVCEYGFKNQAVQDEIDKVLKNLVNRKNLSQGVDKKLRIFDLILNSFNFSQ